MEPFFEITPTLDDFIYSLQQLGLLGLLFLLLAMLVKGKKVLADIYQALPNTGFNLSLMLFNAVMLPPLLSIITIYMLKIESPAALNHMWEILPSFVVVFAAVFAGDFIGYWRHRLEHSRWLWPSHSIHHSDDKMTWLTLQRFHPINRLSTYIIDSSLLIMLGFPAYAVIANNLIRHFYGYFIHADLPWSFGFWGKVFVSPTMHQWHHADEVQAYNTNFATIFSLFDRAFGTYRVPGLCTIPLGVAKVTKLNLFSQLLYPFKPTSYFKSYKAKTLFKDNKTKI